MTELGRPCLKFALDRPTIARDLTSRPFVRQIAAGVSMLMCAAAVNSLLGAGMVLGAVQLALVCATITFFVFWRQGRIQFAASNLQVIVRLGLAVGQQWCAGEGVRPHHWSSLRVTYVYLAISYRFGFELSQGEGGGTSGGHICSIA